MTSPTVAVLASPHPLWREEAILRLREAHPSLVVVRHELETIAVDGCVHRTVTRDITVDTALPVHERCCLSCLLRDDTVRVLAEFGDEPEPAEVLLVLPLAVEPATVAVALADEGHHLDAVVVAVDARPLEDDLTTAAPLGGSGVLPEDPRGHAEVVIRQLRHADVVVHTTADERSAALLEALAPCAAVLDESTPAELWLGTGRHHPEHLREVLQAGVPRPRSSVARAGVSTTRWRRRRPLHPQRLLDVLDDSSLDGVVSGHGHLWVATRPGTVLELEVGADGCDLLAVDAWLAARPYAEADRATPGRRSAAARRWHATYGDRVQELILVALDRDLAEITATLDACLLTDHELAEGEHAWLRWHDPFGPWLGEEATFLGSQESLPHTEQESP